MGLKLLRKTLNAVHWFMDQIVWDRGGKSLHFHRPKFASNEKGILYRDLSEIISFRRFSGSVETKRTMHDIEFEDVSAYWI